MLENESTKLYFISLQVVQMSKSQSAPKIADVADPTMFLLVARSQWLNKYISPSLLYQKTNQPYDINYALIAIAVCLLKTFLL